MGNKIIQITTGLFSNICVEDHTLLFSRKNRQTTTTAKNNNNNNSGTSGPTRVVNTSKPVPIPSSASSTLNDNNIQTGSGGEKNASQNTMNSLGSSQTSTANNSYSSVSVSSSCTMATGYTAASSETTSVMMGKEVVERFEEPTEKNSAENTEKNSI